MGSLVCTVNGTPPSVTYQQDSATSGISINSSGTIDVTVKGTYTITFNKHSGATWNFTGVTISPSGGAVTQSRVSNDSVQLSDDDSANATYTYTLQTSAGDCDPQILNKGN